MSKQVSIFRVVHSEKKVMDQITYLICDEAGTVDDLDPDDILRSAQVQDVIGVLVSTPGTDKGRLVRLNEDQIRDLLASLSGAERYGIK